MAKTQFSLYFDKLDRVGYGFLRAADAPVILPHPAIDEGM